MTKKIPFTAADMKALPTEQVEKALSKLSTRQLEELQKDYHFWARPKQIEPEGNWNVLFFNCGRGFGKTWTGVQIIREKVKLGYRRMAAVASTNSDILRVMVEGDSGFLNLCSKYDRRYDGKYMGFPHWSPTKRTIYWYEHDSKGNLIKDQKGDPKILCQVEMYSAEEPERLRGPQFEFAWCDELAAWSRDEATWSMLKFCNRLKTKANKGLPKIVVTTTPKSTKLVRDLLKNPKTEIVVGSTFENDNMPEAFLEDMKAQFEGTRLGRQELYAEVLTENEGALWTADMIDRCQIELEDLPELVRKVVAVDPAMTANVESDLTGIIVAGIDVNGIGYLLGDYSFKGLPEAWAKKAIDLYHEFDCDRIVYESNQGRDLIPTVMRTIDENIPLKGVHASNAKIARAEPVSALYERDKVKHVRNTKDPEANLTELETQYCTFEPLGKHKSPDRYDAAVWGLTELMLKGYSKPKLQLVYSNNKK